MYEFPDPWESDSTLANLCEQQQRELERLRTAIVKTNDEICQTLGKALGYPYIDHTVCAECDPEKGCTCGNPIICVGEEVAETLALHAARRIERQASKLVEVVEMLKEVLVLLDRSKPITVNVDGERMALTTEGVRERVRFVIACTADNEGT